MKEVKTYIGDIKFLTGLLPGEDWRLVEGVGIVIIHPDKKPILLRDGQRIVLEPKFDG